MKKIRILVVEDNRLMRVGLTAMINRQADMKVVAVAAGGDKTVVKTVAAKAQVVLVDLSGLRIVATLAKKIPGVKVIGMGLIPTQADIVEFVQAGASGFIMKGAPVEDFLMTIRAVAQGEKVLPPPLTHSLFSHVLEHARKSGKESQNKAVRMTKREREIIALIADGLSNKDIASGLNIATYTVKSHVHNILEKLALHSRLQIAKYSNDDETIPTRSTPALPPLPVTVSRHFLGDRESAARRS